MRFRTAIGAGLALGLACLFSCKSGRPLTPLIVNDFESQADLGRIAWHCRTTFAISQQYRTHGRTGLLMTLYPDAYPGLQLFLEPEERRWSGYRYLRLDVINPASEQQVLCYRIDDREHADYADRVNGRFRLTPGLNHLELDLTRLRTSGSGRGLDLGRIDKLVFFLVSPPRPVALGVDYVRLDPDGLP